jgi:3'-phosphoadenosine 5'-phosphosulfate sulfotransferase (PAPS reductase)/FAD synthetase
MRVFDYNMPRRTRQSYLWHSKHKTYQEHVKEAKQNIEHVLENYNPILLYSGGKDSLVLLHMIMQYTKDIPIYYNDSGYDYESQQQKMPKDFTKEILEIGYETGARDIHVGGGSTPSSRKFFGQLFEYMKQEGANLELLGIRGGESVGRKNRVNGPLVRKEGVRTIAFPIRYFTTDDIWSYLIANNVRYLSYYDYYAKIDTYDKVRLSSRFSNGLLFKGGSKYLDGVLLSDYRNEQPKKVKKYDT